MEIETKKLVVTLYKSGLSAYKIADQLNIHPCIVYSILKKFGEPTRSLKESHKRKVDESYFLNIDSSRKAYWLGLLSADGQVQHPRNCSKMLRLDLIEEDGYLVDTLSQDLKLEKENRTFQRTPPNKNIRRMAIYSDILSNSLERFGIIPNKTFNLKWTEEIPSDLISHFVRGYFDGDGNLNVRNRGNDKNPDLTFRLEGTEEFLLSLQNWLVQAIECRKTKLQTRHPERKNSIRSLQYGGRHQVFKIMTLLYKDADIYMIRKYDKFKAAYN